MKAAVRAFVLMVTAGTIPASAHAIDAMHSQATFSVAHIWVERVTGTVPIVSGTVTFAAGSAIPTSAEAVLDATRIETGEPDRDRSLLSPDFFDTQRYPRWMFASTRTVPEGDRAFAMEGDLTIHGVTQPVRLTVRIGGTAADPVYHATTEIDRHAFGMATTRLDPTIGGIVSVTLDIRLVRREANGDAEREPEAGYSGLRSSTGRVLPIHHL